MAFFTGVKIVETEERLEGEQPFLVVHALFEETAACLSIERPSLKDYAIAATVEHSYRDKRVFRDLFKKELYMLLAELSGRTLPWGDLTGVRPTKIAMAWLNEGNTAKQCVEAYKDRYLVFEKKAVLATEVAENERKLLGALDMKNDYCLYIGIPFCPSRCLYCSFTSNSVDKYKSRIQDYIECLKKELSFIAKAYAHRRLVSVYVGGGTPTALEAPELDELLSHVREAFELDAPDAGLLEFTVEAGRPDSITMDKLRVLKKHKVTRISINPQTMKDETLVTIGRAHNTEQTLEAFALARQAGFDNINMDIIAGLPGEKINDMENTLAIIKGLSPESLTVHSLAVKRAARLKQELDEYGSEINMDVNHMLDMVNEAAKSMSMEPYYMYRQKNIAGNLENVGYAAAGSECLYNILIMEELTDIIAAGAGASTKLVFHDENRVERVENCKSVDDYIDRFDEMINRKKIGMADKLCQGI